MAWNPTMEVALARDAAKKLGDAPRCIILWTSPSGMVGMASYGKTRALCADTGKMGDKLWCQFAEMLSEEMEQADA